jgi:hypothetical protein
MGGGDLLAADDGVLRGGGGPGNRLQFNKTPSSGSMMVGGPGNDGFVLRVLRVEEPSADGVTLEAGDGHDSLYLDDSDYDVRPYPPPISFDMTAGTLDTGYVSGTASGFEELIAQSTKAAFDVVGTDGPNIFNIGNEGPATVHGLAGDDTFWTGDGDDTLDGGLGDDTAHAERGINTCTAIEHAFACEVLQP